MASETEALLLVTAVPERGCWGLPAARGWAVTLQAGTSLGVPAVTWDLTFDPDSETCPSRVRVPMAGRGPRNECR